MKKIVVILILSAVALQVKAQLTPSPFIAPKIQVLPYHAEPFKPEISKKLPDAVQTIQPNSDIVMRKNGMLIAKLDHMPIIQPKGNWKTPVINPGNLNDDKMPVFPGAPKRNDTVKVIPIRP